MTLLLIHDFLSVEEHKINAPRGFQLGQVVRDLHQERHARRAVVGSDERNATLGGVEILVGEGPGVVVNADHDAFLAVGVPRADQVDHVHPFARLGVGGGEGLFGQGRPHCLEMLRDHLALPGVCGGSGGAGSDRADFLEIAIGALAVDRDRRGELDRFLLRFGVNRTGRPEENDPQPRENQDDRQSGEAGPASARWAGFFGRHQGLRSARDLAHREAPVSLNRRGWDGREVI